MSVLLLHSAGERFRGRVMGVRMLAIYGVPIGLLIAGGADRRVSALPRRPRSIAWSAAALTVPIALRWRADLWPLDALANAR